MPLGASANEIRNPRSHGCNARPRSGHPHAHGSAAHGAIADVSRRPSRRDRRHFEHHRDSAAADRCGRRRASPRGNRAARLFKPRRCSAHAARDCGHQLRRFRQEHRRPHPRRRALPHAADDRRRQSARHQRAADRPELRLAADDERSRARGGAARTAGLHLRCRRRRRRQRADATRCRRFRRPARPRIR